MHRLAQCMGGGRTRGDQTKVGPSGSGLDRHQAGAHVANECGNGERRHLAGPAFHQTLVLRFERRHATDTRPDDHTDPIRVFTRQIQTGISKRLLRRHKSKVRVAIIPPNLLRIHVRIRIPAAHLGPDLAGVTRGVKQRHPVDAIAPRHHRSPKGVDGLAKPVNHTKTGDDDTLHGCTVGDGALIGIGSILLNRSVIGKHSLVGANSLIPEGKVFPERVLIVGSPGKVVRELTDEEVAGLPGSAERYVENWQRYREELNSI